MAAQLVASRVVLSSTELVSLILSLHFNPSNVLSIISTSILNLWRVSSSGIWCHVALVMSDVSKEYIASIIRANKISELGATLWVTSNCNTLQKILYEEVSNRVGCTSWQLKCIIFFILHSHCCEYLKSYILNLCFSLNVKDQVSNNHTKL
jgi:hypothetical protein